MKMRLIDADDIGNYLFDKFERSRSYNPYDRSNTIHISEVLNVINDMPTIEKCKFGKWIKAGAFVKCSICNCVNRNDQSIRCSFKYCANCGAKMEEGENADE